MNEPYIIEISRGRRKIYRYRRLLEAEGFTFSYKSYGKSTLTKKVNTKEECERYKTFCKKNRIRCEILRREHVRSSDYRKTFFEKTYFPRSWTLCAYCGLPVTVENLTVDHIIPVDKVRKTHSAKWLMELLSIKDVNEYKNLCGACKRCNSRKRAKMGLWVIRGFIGKNQIVWYARWILRMALMLFLASCYIQLIR